MGYCGETYISRPIGDYNLQITVNQTDSMKKSPQTLHIQAHPSLDFACTLGVPGLDSAGGGKEWDEWDRLHMERSNKFMIKMLQILNRRAFAATQLAKGASWRSGQGQTNIEIKIASWGDFATFSSPLRGELRRGETALIVCGSCERRRPQQHQMQSRVPRDGSPNGGLLTKGKL